MTRGDIAVGIVCIFTTGVLVGMTFAPERKFAACTEIKQMPPPKALTEKQKVKLMVWANRDRNINLGETK